MTSEGSAGSSAGFQARVNDCATNGDGAIITSLFSYYHGHSIDMHNERITPGGDLDLTLGHAIFYIFP